MTDQPEVTAAPLSDQEIGRWMTMVCGGRYTRYPLSEQFFKRLMVTIDQLRAENERLRRALSTATGGGCPDCGHEHSSGFECLYLLDKHVDTHCGCEATFATYDQLRAKVAELEAGVLDDEAIIEIVMEIGCDLADHDITKADVPYLVREEIARRKGAK